MRLISRGFMVLCSLLGCFVSSLQAQDAAAPIKVGIIGVDTSHAVEFARIFNDEKAKDHIPGIRVVAAYPHGSPDIESSVSRIPANTETIRNRGVKIVESIEELLPLVDAVLLETNDGRPHLEQAKLVIAAKKPLFVDKPITASLAEAGQLMMLASDAGVPLFSSSSLRFTDGALAARNGDLGEVRGCEAYSPESREKTHPTLYWYGIHGVETLFTVMGSGCDSVIRIENEGADLVVGTWQGGRIGTFRGLRPEGNSASGYGGTVFGSKKIAPIGPFKGYQPLAKAIQVFFATDEAPVSLRETLEIYAFMEAADESARQGGKMVTIAEVLEKAGLDPNLFK